MFQMIPAWWLLIAVICIMFLIFIIIMKLDQGHRGFVVANVTAVDVLAPILRKYSGIRELVTCTTEPVYQVMMSTGLVLTVPVYGVYLKNIEPAATLKILAKEHPDDRHMTVQELAAKTGYIPNFCSFLSSKPTIAVEETSRALRTAGFSTFVLDGFMPQAKENIALLASDAFDGWILVFRRHLLLMPIPDLPRLLTRQEGWFSLPRIMRTDGKVRNWFKNR